MCVCWKYVCKYGRSLHLLFFIFFKYKLDQGLLGCLYNLWQLLLANFNRISPKRTEKEAATSYVNSSLSQLSRGVLCTKSTLEKAKKNKQNPHYTQRVRARDSDAVPKLELETLRKTKFKSKMPAKNDAKNKSKTITSACGCGQGTRIRYPVVRGRI